MWAERCFIFPLSSTCIRRDCVSFLSIILLSAPWFAPFSHRHCGLLIFGLDADPAIVPCMLRARLVLMNLDCLLMHVCPALGLRSSCQFHVVYPIHGSDCSPQTDEGVLLSSRIARNLKIFPVRSQICLSAEHFFFWVTFIVV